MGHYLSDFETSDEHCERVVYQPMRADLRVYDQERSRGLVHTEEYSRQMEENRAKIEKWDAR